jgi:DNA-binding transcriptional ArsR family regulator
MRYKGCPMNAYDLQAELLKVLAHPVRLQILDILRDGEQCVCHLQAVLGLRQAYVSQQLMELRELGLVADRKEGLRVFYSVRDPSVYAILDVARSLVGRQAHKRGLTLSFELSDGATRRPCDCPKCAPQTSAAFAH